MMESGRGNVVKRFSFPLLLAVLCASALGAQTTVPAVYPVLTDGFETGSTENWVVAPGSDLAVSSGSPRSGSWGLEVVVSQAESHLVRGGRRDLSRADEGYLTFWFDPNGVVFNDPGTGWIPGRSIQIAAIRGPDFKPVVALRFRKVGSGYEGYLEWMDSNGTFQFDYQTGSFPISDGFQQITIGYRVDDWIACWVDGSNVRSIASGIGHVEPYGSVIEVGKTTLNDLIAPSGTLFFDDVSYELPRYIDLWVDGSAGDDGNDGLTKGTAFRTISRASDLAGAGTTVHILPGTYREAVVPAQGGLSGDPVVYKADDGPGTVVVRGSVASQDLPWTQLFDNSLGLPTDGRIWWADLSGRQSTAPPQFVVRMDGARVADRLPMAREPDWSIATLHKESELWWSADGGSAPASCDPTTDPDRHCDLASRSTTHLTDVTDDARPTGVEPGNLTTLGDLTGATIVALDTERGHYHYRREIVGHDVGAGRVTVDSSCTIEQNASKPGLGWSSKYYVEGLPSLLDTPAEWWYDPSTARLYLWPPVSKNPAQQQIEITWNEIGFELKDRNHVVLRDLVVELFDGTLVENWNFTWHKSVGNRISGSTLRYGKRGVWLSQRIEAGTHEDKRIEGFVLTSSELAHIDYEAVRVGYLWGNGNDPSSWVRPGVHDTTITGNLIHHVGFRAAAGDDSTAGIVIRHGDRLTLEGNTISDFSHNGVHILESVIHSPDSWGFSPSEIKVGQILVKDNVVERICNMNNDCGGIRVWGPPPDEHVFRELLFVGNTFREVFGWGWPAELRRIDSHGQIPGAGGSGLYFDGTSGAHVYRNLAYNNGLAGFYLIKRWRDGRIVLADNVLANNVFGVRFGGLFADTHTNFDTQVINNVFTNNEAYGVVLEDLDGDYSNTAIHHNLYFENGWGSDLFKPGAMNIVHDGSQEYWQTVPEIQANTPFESDGQGADPLFVRYDPGDHDPFDSSWPDFRIQTGSPAVDAGTASLPPTLSSLLSHFSVEDSMLGTAWDQGAFEGAVTCDDITLEGQTVTTTESFETCGWIFVGPDYHVASTGDVTLRAGQSVVFVAPVSVEFPGLIKVLSKE